MPPHMPPGLPYPSNSSRNGSPLLPNPPIPLAGYYPNRPPYQPYVYGGYEDIANGGIPPMHWNGAPQPRSGQQSPSYLPPDPSTPAFVPHRNPNPANGRPPTNPSSLNAPKLVVQSAEVVDTPSAGPSVDKPVVFGTIGAAFSGTDVPIQVVSAPPLEIRSESLETVFAKFSVGVSDDDTLGRISRTRSSKGRSRTGAVDDVSSSPVAVVVADAKVEREVGGGIDASSSSKWEFGTTSSSIGSPPPDETLISNGARLPPMSGSTSPAQLPMEPIIPSPPPFPLNRLDQFDRVSGPYDSEFTVKDFGYGFGQPGASGTSDRPTQRAIEEEKLAKIARNIREEQERAVAEELLLHTLGPTVPSKLPPPPRPFGSRQNERGGHGGGGRRGGGGGGRGPPNPNNRGGGGRNHPRSNSFHSSQPPPRQQQQPLISLTPPPFQQQPIMHLTENSANANFYGGLPPRPQLVPLGGPSPYLPPPPPPPGFDAFTITPQVVVPPVAPVPQAAGQPHVTPPVPVPMTTLSFPLDPTRYYLLGQLEYYLSPQNMAQDFFLRQRMDARGWIPILLIASFNRIRRLTIDANLVREVLYLSSMVQVRDNWVRMGGWERFVLPDAPASVVLDNGERENANAPYVFAQMGMPVPVLGQDVGQIARAVTQHQSLSQQEQQVQLPPPPPHAAAQAPPQVVVHHVHVDEDEEEEDDEDDFVFVMGKDH